mmetsp:Transcript_6965/g.7648  ORF Transcript_6965/g.7648 Transcript_6965/m.7648 type:complete len:335 (+) Transcript_6965:44-1048(+)
MNNGKRRYKDWPSENKFYCGGRIITGPDSKYFYATASSIIAPGIVFLAGVAFELIREIKYGWVLVVIMLFLWIQTIVLFFSTSFSDPGILPRAPPPKELEESPFSWEDKRPPVTRDYKCNGVKVTEKYCDTCHIYRPPRASHCPVCNNCVLRFDHHCPWVGNCIGQRNYRRFFIFSWSATTLIITVFGFCVTDLVVRVLMNKNDNGMGTGRAIGETLKNPTSAALGIYCFCILWPVLSLCSFHSYLVTTGYTTREKCSPLHAGKKNPFAKGCCYNWIYICCPPNFPSHIKPTEYIGTGADSDIENGTSKKSSSHKPNISSAQSTGNIESDVADD